MESRENRAIQTKTGQTAVKTHSTRSRLGRPTRAEARRRHEELLEVALDTFLEHGFEQTTILEIAKQVGMSKRTVYAYYEDKADLFKAAVRRAIDRYVVPLETLKAAESDDLEATLTAVAQIRIDNVTRPEVLKLQRILSAQAFRFPELIDVAFEVGAGPTIAFLSELFTRFHNQGELRVDDPERTAVAFLSLVVSGPARSFISGRSLSEEALESHVSFTVHLFLNGIRPR